MSRTGLRGPDAGFTLVEILVSLVIFSIVLLPLTAVLVAESKFERSYEHKLVALTVAKNEIETVKKTFAPLEDEEYQVAMAGRLWDVQRTVEDSASAARDTSLPAGLCAVTIKVSRENDTLTLAEIRVLKETYR